MAGTAAYALFMNHPPVSLPLRLIFLFLMLLSGPVAPACFAVELQAGLARIDITPTNPVMLAGYASRKELSDQVHDPLFARALAFDQDHRRLVFVAVDNCGF